MPGSSWFSPVRVLAGLTGISVTATLLVAVDTGTAASALAAVAPSSAQQEQDVTERPDALSAEREALRLGHRVEIASLRTSTSSTFALPSGSREWVSSTFLRNVPNASGVLEPASSDVVRGATGELTADHHALRPSFAMAASPSAVSIMTDAGPVTFGLTSARATSLAAPLGTAGVSYPGVLPGVEARYALTADRVEEKLVLSSAAAGSAWMFTYNAPGMAAQQDPDGSIRFVDAQGTTTLVIPVGSAWDSAGVRSTVPVIYSLIGSGSSVRIVATVDPTWISSPARVWPVFVDPTALRPTLAVNAYREGGYKCDTCSPRAGNRSSTATELWRSSVAFDYDVLFGAHVLSSKIDSTRRNGTSNCYNHVWKTVVQESFANQTSASSPSTLTTNSGLCDTGTSSGAALTSWLQGVLDSRAQGRRIMLYVTETPKTNTWKEVDSTWSVTYNSYPDMAQPYSVDPCFVRCTSASETNSLTPQLTATGTDADGGALRFDFELHGSGSEQPIATAQVSNIAQGMNATWTVPQGALIDGGVYWFTVRTFDGTDYSPWSPEWDFAVDRTPPAASDISSSTWPRAEWVAATSGDLSWGNSSADVEGFRYWLDGQAPSTLQPTTQVHYANLTAGQHILSVEALDAAGNSTLSTYAFNVGSGAVTSPANEDRTQDSVTLQATPTDPAGYPYVRFDWAPGTTSSGGTSWQPTRTLTVPGTGATPTATGQGTYPRASYPSLTWGAVSDAGLDGLVRVRACFATSSAAATSVCTQPNILQISRTAFGASQATMTLGPGSLSTLTGDLSITASDAVLSTFGGALTVNRTATTLSPPAATGAAGALGPGWMLSLPDPGSGRADVTLTNQSAQGFVVLSDPDGGQEVWTVLSSGPTSRTYAPVGDAADGAMLTESPLGTFTVTDTDGTRTTWTPGSSTAPVTMSAINTPGVGSPVYLFDPATKLLTSVTGQAPSGIACASNPLGTVGCRSLRFTYGGPTSSDATLAQRSGLFDVAGRLAQIDAVVTNSAGVIVTTPVARYGYDGSDSGAHLAAVWDPRVSPVLVTRYSYQNGHRLRSITPAGLTPWILGLDGRQRVTTVARRDDLLSQDATTTVAYGVPWQGSAATSVGLPDMTVSQTRTWAQDSDVVANATAIFPPDHRPSTAPASSDWPYASVHYLDANGRLVNTASYGGSWHITTSTYDLHGNTIRELTADNRAQALTPTADTDPSVKAMQDNGIQTGTQRRALALSSLWTYTADGADLLDSLGPVHPTKLSGISAPLSGRTHSSLRYDEGAPTGGPFHLVTTSTTTTQLLDDSEQEPHFTRTGYNALASADGSGWSLRQPTSVRTEGTDGRALTRWTRFDSTGRVIQSRLPGGASSNGVGIDSRSTNTVYYAVQAPAPCSSVAYAGLVCTTGPAAQPGSNQPGIPPSFPRNASRTTPCGTSLSRWWTVTPATVSCAP